MYIYVHIYSSCINKNWFDLSIEILPVSKLSHSKLNYQTIKIDWFQIFFFFSFLVITKSRMDTFSLKLILFIQIIRIYI